MKNAEVAKVQNLIWRGDICLWWHCKEGSEHCTHHGRLKPSSETNLKTCKKAPTTNKHGPKLLKQAWISCRQPPTTLLCKHTDIKHELGEAVLYALLSRYEKWNWPWEAKTLWVQSFAHLPIWWRGWSGMQLLITFQWHKKTLQIKLTICQFEPR